jgi:radical SAM superfamily enzyme YgiQ (UPF0313 family)
MIGKPMEKRILLVEPPFYRLFKDTYSLNRYPLSLGYLSAAIEVNTAWDVMAYNADFNPIPHESLDLFSVAYMATTGFSNYQAHLHDITQPLWQEVISAVTDYKPAVVGISAKSQTFASACLVAHLVKSIDPQIIIIVGGPHPSIVGSSVLAYPDIDIAVHGEGELTIVELLDAIANAKDLSLVAGISYRIDDRIITTSPRNPIADLDTLPFPYTHARSALRDYDKYSIQALSNIFATRGCPYNCFFCGSHKMWGRRVRFRSPANVVAQIRQLMHNGATSVYFDDDTFGVNRHYLQGLCDALIRNCSGLTWGCELHVRLVTEENIELMKKAGCAWINLGIESGNDEILRKIRKGITVADALSACAIIRHSNIRLVTFFMIGFPWETEATLHDTVALMKQTRSSSVYYSIFTPYPGTEAFEYCRDHGMIDDKYDVSLHYHQSPANYFSPRIEREKFRKLALKIEKMVDRMNEVRPYTLIGIARLCSWKTVRKVRELGLVESVKRVFGIMFCR